MAVTKTPSGKKVTLKEAADFTHGDRKQLMAIDDSLSRVAQGFALMDNLLCIAILDWDYDLLIPSVKRESLDSLSPEEFDAIADACKPLMDALNPKTTKSDEADADPKAPTDS